MGFDIVRLQVQRRPLKTGRAPQREYQPAALQSVSRVEIGPRGAVGVVPRMATTTNGDAGSAERILDVHHRDHPQTRDPRGEAGVTIMGTGDYLALRQAYGPHLIDGLAAETILVDAPNGLARRQLPPRFTVHTALGAVPFVSVRAADPCVEFARFCLGESPSAQVSEAVRQALIDLDDGARGYRAVATHAGVLQIGDRVEFD